MAKISTELTHYLTANPEQNVDLIVRTRGDATPHLTWLAKADIQVNQLFRLSPGVAISCLGQDAMQLLDQDWILSIERDQPLNLIG